MKRIPINVDVNGVNYALEVLPSETLLDVLRNQLQLTGTKESCGEGDCGACTVIMDGNAINSCLVLAAECNGKSVLTIEGLSKGGDLHPIQQAFIDNGAIQCGYCTPGMVMSAKALLDSSPEPTEDEIKIGLSGNICRCTGYVKIIKAVEDAAQRLKHSTEQEGA